MARPTQDVDRFLAALDHPMKPALERLRRAILAADVSITERIRWNAPSFCHGGDDRATFRIPPRRGELQLVLHRGVKPRPGAFSFEDPSGLVEWAAPDRGIVTLRSDGEARRHAKAIVELVRAWMRATA